MDRRAAAQAAAVSLQLHWLDVQLPFTDRHVRIRDGTALSDLFRMKNGSSVISPVLFVNDIPEPQNDVKLCVYADDSAIWTKPEREPATLAVLPRSTKEILTRVGLQGVDFKDRCHSIPLLRYTNSTPAAEAWNFDSEIRQYRQVPKGLSSTCASPGPIT